MPTRIKPKRSTTQGQIPGLNDLEDGEMAINIVDQKIYVRVGNDVETVAQAATGATPIFTEVTGPTTTQLVVNKRYLMNTSDGVINATMPIVNLSPGDSIEMGDGGQNWNINNVILTSASHQFKDAIGNLDDGPVNLDVSGVTVMFLWTGSYWRIIS
jgi:hypothetical protein